MSGTKARMNWKYYGETAYRTAQEAIRAIDKSVENDPENAKQSLLHDWTALNLFKMRGVPDPKWIAPMSRFARLSIGQRDRVSDAIDMRLRAIAPATPTA